MKIEKIQIKNLLGTEKAEVELNPNVTLLYGTNGAGKTTIVDAIFLTTHEKIPRNLNKNVINKAIRRGQESSNVQINCGKITGITQIYSKPLSVGTSWINTDGSADFPTPPKATQLTNYVDLSNYEVQKMIANSTIPDEVTQNQARHLLGIDREVRIKDAERAEVENDQEIKATRAQFKSLTGEVFGVQKLQKFKDGGGGISDQDKQTIQINEKELQEFPDNLAALIFEKNQLVHQIQNKLRNKETRSEKTICQTCSKTIIEVTTMTSEEEQNLQNDLITARELLATTNDAAEKKRALEIANMRIRDKQKFTQDQILQIANQHEALLEKKKNIAQAITLLSQGQNLIEIFLKKHQPEISLTFEGGVIEFNLTPIGLCSKGEQIFVNTLINLALILADQEIVVIDNFEDLGAKYRSVILTILKNLEKQFILLFNANNKPNIDEDSNISITAVGI